MSDPHERFFAKVIVGDCWHWVGSKNSSGYGQFWFEGAMPTAHRWLWETLVGPIQEGLQLDHLCRNRSCVNPDHLEPVTPSLNVRRSEGPAAQNVRKTHCPAGHELRGDNLIDLRGNRRCRECQRGHDRKYRSSRAQRAA